MDIKGFRLLTMQMQAQRTNGTYMARAITVSRFISDGEDDKLPQYQSLVNTNAKALSLLQVYNLVQPRYRIRGWTYALPLMKDASLQRRVIFFCRYESRTGPPSTYSFKKKSFRVKFCLKQKDSMLTSLFFCKLLLRQCHFDCSSLST